MSEGENRVLVTVALRDLDYRKRISPIMAATYMTPQPDFFVMVHNPYPTQNDRNLYDPWPNILYKYELARNAATEGWYDFLFLVEDDIVLPPDALKKLVGRDAPVISGIYRLRPEVSGGRAPLAVFRFTEQEQQQKARWPTSISNRGQNAPHGMFEVDAVAFGCLLIRRDVFSSIEFDVDMEYSVALRERPVSMHVDGDVYCGHICRDGSIVNP